MVIKTFFHTFEMIIVLFFTGGIFRINCMFSHSANANTYLDVIIKNCSFADYEGSLCLFIQDEDLHTNLEYLFQGMVE